MTLQVESAKSKLMWSINSGDFSAHLTPRECEALLSHIQRLEDAAGEATGTVDVREREPIAGQMRFLSGDPGDEQPE